MIVRFEVCRDDGEVLMAGTLPKIENVNGSRWDWFAAMQSLAIWQGSMLVHHIRIEASADGEEVRR